MINREFVTERAYLPTEITCDNCGLKEKRAGTYYGEHFITWIKFETKYYNGDEERDDKTLTYCCVNCLIEDLINRDLRGIIKIPTIAGKENSK